MKEHQLTRLFGFLMLQTGVLCHDDSHVFWVSFVCGTLVLLSGLHGLGTEKKP